MRFYVYCILMLSLCEVSSLTWRITLGIQPQIRELNWQGWIRLREPKDNAGGKGPCKVSTCQVPSPNSCSKLMLRQTAQGCIRWVLKTSQDRDYTASLSNLLHCIAAVTWKSFSFYQVGTCPIPVYDLCVLFPSHAPPQRARLCLLEALPAGFGRGCSWVPLKLPLGPPQLPSLSSQGKCPLLWLSSAGHFSGYQRLPCIGRP